MVESILINEDRIKYIEDSIAELFQYTKELYAEIAKLKNSIESSQILTQESCSHENTTTYYDFDGEQEIPYDSCDNCGREWH